jgi:type II secretory pathway pseudopilin PulG
MNSIKCIHCGLINWADAEACKRCGNPPGAEAQEAGGWASPVHGGQAWGEKKRKGLAVASLVLGILSIFTLGLLLVGALTALVMGIVALVRAGKQPHVYGGRGLAVGGIVTSAFSLVMIVPLAIIAAIAIPNLVAARRAANEGSAISSVREIILAQGTYSATVGAGSYGSLEELGAASLIEGGLVRGRNHGYQFDLVATEETCAVSAVPVNYGSTGRRSFYATCGEGEIHFADKGGLAANDSDPVLDESPSGAAGYGPGPQFDAYGRPTRTARPRY